MKAFVIARDRVTYARQCVDALLTAGLEVVVVDHGSTWEPMRAWLNGPDRLSAIWPVTISLGGNAHPRDLWRPHGPISHYVEAGERFIVTDCDVVPDETCPADWVQRLGQTLNRLPALRKVGLGLRTDDIPSHYPHRGEVRRWEAQFQAVGDGGNLNPMMGDDGAVIADIDTTLAMYRYYEPFTLGPAVRLRPPYVARHLTWYEDASKPSPEQEHYREHAVHGHWRAPSGYVDEHGLGNA